MKSRTMKYLAIALGILALLVSINAIYRKNYILGISGILICAFLLYFSTKVEQKEVKMPFPEVVKAYKSYMETYFRTTIPQDIKVYYVEENDRSYIAVLCYEDKEEALLHYFPFEADKFTAEFGRGTGQYFEDIREVEFWINKYDKTFRATEEIAKNMGSQIAKRIREEMEFYNKAKEDEEGTRTSGGSE